MEKLQKLLEALDMPGEFIPRILEAAASQPLAPGETDEEGTAELAGQLLIALEERESGAWKGLPEDIWLATMKCFTRFVGEHIFSYGWPAFDRGWWTTRQIHARLFRVGELEYELYEYKEEKGRRAVSLHIPSDACMTMDRLDDSVARARAFLKEYFPDWADLPMFCESWLLSPALKQLLPPGSHILGFQRAFDLYSVDPETPGVKLWVYKLTREQQSSLPLEQLPEETTLQRNMKAFLLQGGKVGVAAGRLARPFQAET